MPQTPLSFDKDFARCKHKTSEYIERHGPINHPYDPVTKGDWFSTFLHIPGSCYVYREPWQLEVILQYWLEVESDVDSRNYWSQTPLLNSAGLYWDSSSTYMSLLIKYGANVHAVDYRGRGALHLVSDLVLYPISTTEVKAQLVLLLEAGCDPNATDHDGRTPLRQFQRGSQGWEIWTTALEKTRGRRVLLHSERLLELNPISEPHAPSGAQNDGPTPQQHLEYMFGQLEFET